MEDLFVYGWIAAGAFVGGIISFYLLLLMLPRKLRSENLIQKQVIIKEAKQKSSSIKGQEIDRTLVRIQIASEELETEIQDRTSDLKSMEENFAERESYLKHEEARVQKREKEMETLQQKADRSKEEFDQYQTQLVDSQNQLSEKLASIAGLEISSVTKSLSEDFVQKRQVETNRHLRTLADELQTNAQRLANRILARTHSRYAPEFIWPKGINHVELTDERLIETLSGEESTLLANLSELSEGVNITLVPAEKEGHATVVRFAGGFGIYKESAKLAFEEMINRGPAYFNKLPELYGKHKSQLEQKATQLGKHALQELRLDGMHIEILKLVGALNWRTSYRQNQYYHSIEVAKLAGILAVELGVDPDQAKRCGLLHDIGKAIDYRIEGSHAVISGDYADRFGESKMICDTVMSHHSDLIVETPLAYVLMTADTLSGARPGARVNLEEGYQDRLSSIQDVVKAFPGVMKIEIMNGAREIHVEVNHKKVSEAELEKLSSQIAREIEENVAFPGQIKILVTRRFESVAVA